MKKTVSTFLLIGLMATQLAPIGFGASETDNYVDAETRLETCAGDVWRTKQSNVTKTGIVHPSFGKVKRYTSAYLIPAKSTVNVSIGGYGVSVSLGNGTGYYSVPANSSRASTITMTVTGDIQQKQSNSCTTMTRFVKKSERGVVRYY